MQLAVCLATIAAALTFVSTASAAPWYWTPGFCKTMLAKKTIETADGRYIYPQQSFCVGLGTSCKWNSAHTQHLYRDFFVITRSYNGNVRTLRLHVTGKKTAGFSQLRLRYRYMDLLVFFAYVKPLVHAAAIKENTLCPKVPKG